MASLGATVSRVNYSGSSHAALECPRGAGWKNKGDATYYSCKGTFIAPEKIAINTDQGEYVAVIAAGAVRSTNYFFERTSTNSIRNDVLYDKLGRESGHRCSINNSRIFFPLHVYYTISRVDTVRSVAQILQSIDTPNVTLSEHSDFPAID